MKKEKKSLLVGIIATILIVGLLGTGYGIYKWKFAEQTPATQAATVCGDGICHLSEYNAGACPGDCGGTIANSQAPVSTGTGGLVYVDLYGNLMDKAKFSTDSSNAYAGVASQSVKFYDITKNAQNDPRTNLLAVPDFQIVASATTNGLLSGTKKGVAGHTYVYFFENTTGSYYDVSGTFTIPANVNAFAPAFDFGNVLAPAVGTLKIYNESGIQTDTQPFHANFSADAGNWNSTTRAVDLRIEVGSNTFSDFVRIWGEYSSTTVKAEIIGVSAVQKSGPTTGVTIDSSDEKNPIITINELTAQYPLTFTYYFQGGTSMVTDGDYVIYADDWNAVPGKFGSKIDTYVQFHCEQ